MGRARLICHYSYKEAAIKKFTTHIRVYWSDCDAAGITYYGNFFRYFEMAEEELFCSLGHPRPELMKQHQMGFPRVETWARFRKPANQGDLLEVSTWIERRTEKSLLYCFEARRDGESELVAEGSYWVVCVSRPQFHPIPVPQAVLDVLKDYLPPVSRRSRGHAERHPHRDVSP